MLTHGGQPSGCPRLAIMCPWHGNQRMQRVEREDPPGTSEWSACPQADPFPSKAPSWRHHLPVWTGSCSNKVQLTMVQRNTWKLLTSANGETQFPHFQVAPWMGTAWPGVAFRLKCSGILLDNTFLLTTILTNVTEILSHSKVGYFYLWSREDPFLVVANGNIHHPVIMALKKSRVLRGSRGEKNLWKNNKNWKTKSRIQHCLLLRAANCVSLVSPTTFKVEYKV